MEFQEQTITIKTKLGDKSITAMVGISSGLAYHRLDGAYDADFSLTHVASGYGIASQWHADTPEEAQRWLEKVAKMLNWTSQIAEIKTAAKKKGGDAGMKHLVTEALEECWEEMPEPIEDGIPANWPEEPLSIKTIRE